MRTIIFSNWIDMMFFQNILVKDFFYILKIFIYNILSIKFINLIYIMLIYAIQSVIHHFDY